MKSTIEECPVKFLSLHSKMQALLKDGIVTQENVNYRGIGTGMRYLYNGNPVKSYYSVGRRGIKGRYCSDEYRDIAVCTLTGELVCFAPAL